MQFNFREKKIIALYLDDESILLVDDGACLLPVVLFERHSRDILLHLGYFECF